MTAPPSGVQPAEVWGSTWIPGASPIDGFGDATGYSIAWVRVSDGPMLMVLVDAAVAPAPGTSGEVSTLAVDDESLDVFTPATEGAA